VLAQRFGRGVAFFEAGNRRVGAYQLGCYTNRTCSHDSSDFLGEIQATRGCEDHVVHQPEVADLGESTTVPASLEESSGRHFDYSAAGSARRSWDPREAARVIWLTGEAF